MLFVGIIDTLMVSYAGEAAVSGVSLVNQINAIFISVFVALASGGAVIISQYIGKKDKRNSILSASQLLTMACIFSILLMSLILIFRGSILQLLFGGVEREVMEAASTYLFITALSFPALAIYNSCSSLLRSISKTKMTMIVSIIMNIINVIGNYIGVFVLHAGVAGVAIPSLISRAIAAILLVIICSNKQQAVFIRFKDFFTIKKEMIGRIVSIALPNGIENGLIDGSKVVLSTIVAMFGTTQIAANGVAQSFWSMSALFSIAMGPVFITVIGQCIGGNDQEAADYYVRKLLRITFLGCIAWNTLFLLGTPLILNLYNLSDETVQLIILLCFIHNFFSSMFHPGGFVLSNALRAAGDVKYTMYTSLFATVVCRVVLSIFFGIWLNLGVVGVSIAMVFDWVVRTILISFRYKQGKWKKIKVI